MELPLRQPRVYTFPRTQNGASFSYGKITSILCAKKRVYKCYIRMNDTWKPIRNTTKTNFTATLKLFFFGIFVIFFLVYTWWLIPLAPPGVDIYAKPHEKWYIISLTTICDLTFAQIWDHNIEKFILSEPLNLISRLTRNPIFYSF